VSAGEEVCKDAKEYDGNEPILTSLCVQGIFQADSGIANSLIGLPKPKSTKSLNDSKTIMNSHDLILGA
jgi:hypothetical protein